MTEKTFSWKAIALASAFFAAAGFAGGRLTGDNTPPAPVKVTTTTVTPTVQETAPQPKDSELTAFKDIQQKFFKLSVTASEQAKADALKNYVDALVSLKAPDQQDLQLALAQVIDTRYMNGLIGDEVVTYAQKLVDVGADINSDFKTASGGSHPPLHRMIQAGRLKALQHFLARGANVEAIDYNGPGSFPHRDTPLLTLMSSMTYNGCVPVSVLHQEMLRALLDAKADVHARDATGKTVLERALWLTYCAETEQTPAVKKIGLEKFTTVVDMMVPYGLNVNVPNEKGQSALDYARANIAAENPDAVVYLEKLAEVKKKPVAGPAR